MQHRMKEFSMTPEATLALLGRGQVGVLSTSGADGAPYGVPVHYLWQDGKLWFHGLPAGEKLENIARDHRHRQVSPLMVSCSRPAPYSRSRAVFRSSGRKRLPSPAGTIIMGFVNPVPERVPSGEGNFLPQGRIFMPWPRLKKKNRG